MDKEIITYKDRIGKNIFKIFLQFVPLLLISFLLLKKNNDSLPLLLILIFLLFFSIVYIVISFSTYKIEIDDKIIKIKSLFRIKAIKIENIQKYSIKLIDKDFIYRLRIFIDNKQYIVFDKLKRTIIML